MGTVPVGSLSGERGERSAASDDGSGTPGAGGTRAGRVRSRRRARRGTGGAIATCHSITGPSLRFLAFVVAASTTLALTPALATSQQQRAASIAIAIDER